MVRKPVCLAGAAMMIALGGCSTMGGGGKDMNAIIIDTQKRVTKMNTDVDKLNATTAELSAHLQTSENSNAALQNAVEDSQKKLQNLERDLREFRNAVYRDRGLSSGSPAPLTGPVTVEQPNAPAPAPMPPPPPGATPAEPAKTPVGGSDSFTQPLNAPPPPPAGAPDDGAMDLYAKAQRTYTNAQDNPALLSQAVQEFDGFLAKYPDTKKYSANANFWKGKCYLSMTQYDNAIRAFEDLRTKFPTDEKIPFAMQNQAVAHNALGQVDKAINLLQRVIADYPNSPVADQAKLDLQKLKSSSH